MAAASALLEWSRQRQQALRCGEGKEIPTGAAMLPAVMTAENVAFAPGVPDVSLLFCPHNYFAALFAWTLAENTPPQSSSRHSRSLSLMLEVTANDRRNRRGSSLGRSCPLERFQGSGPPKSTNRGRRRG